MYRKRRGYKNKRGFRKTRRVSYRNLQRQISKLRKDTRPELKVKDTIETDIDVFTTPIVASLTVLSQGVTESTRVGDKVQLKSLQIKGFIAVPAAQLDPIVCRIVVVRSKQPQGTAPVWTDVFNSASVYSLRNIDNAGNFQIMYDRNYTVINDEDGTVKNNIVFKLFKKANYQAEYNGANTVNQTNGLYLMMMSTGATNDVNISYEARIRYTDV